MPLGNAHISIILILLHGSKYNRIALLKIAVESICKYSDTVSANIEIYIQRYF